MPPSALAGYQRRGASANSSTEQARVQSGEEKMHHGNAMRSLLPGNAATAPTRTTGRCQESSHAGDSAEHPAPAPLRTVPGHAKARWRHRAAGLRQRTAEKIPGARHEAGYDRLGQPLAPGRWQPPQQCCQRPRHCKERCRTGHQELVLDHVGGEQALAERVQWAQQRQSEHGPAAGEQQAVAQPGVPSTTGTTPKPQRSRRIESRDRGQRQDDHQARHPATFRRATAEADGRSEELVRASSDTAVEDQPGRAPASGSPGRRDRPPAYRASQRNVLFLRALGFASRAADSAGAPGKRAARERHCRQDDSDHRHDRHRVRALPGYQTDN